jgi:hypothetical protein
MYTKWTSGPKLRVTAVLEPLPNPGLLSLILRVQNVGTVATTITNLAFRQYLSRWARFWNRPARDEVSRYILTSPHEPYKLEVGDQRVFNIKLIGEAKGLLTSGQLWCGVVHSFSKKPTMAKISEG